MSYPESIQRKKAGDFEQVLEKAYYKLFKIVNLSKFY
jgi:hypothetical protein